MTLRLLLAGLCCILSSSLIAQNQLPAQNVKTLDGHTVNINSYANNGKITIISFWATWCSPCKKELDAIAEVYEDWQEEYNVELVAVSIDTRRAQAKIGPMVATKGWEYEIILDAAQELKNAMQVQAVPHTFVINLAGEIVYNHSGYLPGDENNLEELLISLQDSAGN